MAAGIGGVLILGAGITLLLALLRMSDGSLMLSSAVQRPPRLKLLGGGGDTKQASAQQHSRLEPHLTEEEEEDEEEEVEAAAERWLLYETGGNGIVDLEGIPPPHPHHQNRQHSPPIQHAFVFPPPWNKRDRHPFRPSGSAGEPPGETHLDTAETAPGAGDGGGGGGGEGGGGGGPLVLPKDLANQFMLRSPRGHREYDVPQIGEWYLFYPSGQCNPLIALVTCKWMSLMPAQTHLLLRPCGNSALVGENCNVILMHGVEGFLKQKHISRELRRHLHSVGNPSYISIVQNMKNRNVSHFTLLGLRRNPP